MGSSGYYEDRAIDEGVLILGWTHEDVSNFTQDEIRSAIQKEHPNVKPNTVNIWARMTHKFVKIEIGDFVMVDLKTRQCVAIGKITGPYTKGDDDEHLRPVEWLRLDIDKSDLGEDVQGTLRSQQTISGVGFDDAVVRIKHIVTTSKDPGPSSYPVEDMVADLPSRSDLMLPTLQALDDLGGSASVQELSDKLADNLNLTDELRNIPHEGGGGAQSTEFGFRSAWACSQLKPLQVVSNPERGIWAITDVGRWHLKNSTNEDLISLHKDFEKNQRQNKQSKAIGMDPELNSHLELVTATETESEASNYSIEDIVEEGCFVEQDRIRNMLDRLQTKKNLILQGPPGTGKTWLAKRLAWALVGWKDARHVRAVQFHPNLSYEDFVRGWRPSSDGRLDLVDGPFLEMVGAAKKDTKGTYVLVIEEINRGNPAQILGEMLTLLEADKRSPENALELTYKLKDEQCQGVHLPPNLHVVGTMNIADRSLALVDLALRRRFAFVDLLPEIGKRWKAWVSDQCRFEDSILSDIEERMSSLNETIANDPKLGRQFQVGHSYVTPLSGTETNPSTWYRDVVESEIGPLLDEYWFDAPDKARQERDKLLDGLDWL